MEYQIRLVIALLGFMAANAQGDDHLRSSPEEVGSGGVRPPASSLAQQVCSQVSATFSAATVVDPLVQTGIFDEMYFSSVASGAVEFLRRLRSVAEAGAAEIRLGFGGAGGPLANGLGQSLTSIFVSTEKCSTQCSLCEVMTATSGPCHLSGSRVQKGTGVQGSSGICGELTVAHGLRHTRLVDDAWPGVRDGEHWDSDFIERIWSAAGSSTTGTSNSDQQAAFRAEWNQGYYASCSRTRFLDDLDLAQWCRSLATDAVASACQFGLAEGGSKKKSAHAMFIHSAHFVNGRCEIYTVNTGKQGSPMGTHVPVQPGLQLWEVAPRAEGETGAHPYTVRNTEGEDVAFWNALNFEKVDTYCCERKRRGYLFSPYPFEAGSAFD